MLFKKSKFKFLRGPLIVIIGFLYASYGLAFEASELRKENIRDIVSGYYAAESIHIKFTEKSPKSYGLLDVDDPADFHEIMKTNGYMLLEERLVGMSCVSEDGCGTWGSGHAVFQLNDNPSEIMGMNFGYKRSPITCKFKVIDLIHAKEMQEQ